MPSITWLPTSPQKPPPPKSAPATPLKSADEESRLSFSTIDKLKSQVTSKASYDRNSYAATATRTPRSKPSPALPSGTTPSRNLQSQKRLPSSTTSKVSCSYSDIPSPLRKSAYSKVKPRACAYDLQASKRIFHGRDERPPGAAYKLRDVSAAVRMTRRDESAICNKGGTYLVSLRQSRKTF